MAVDTGDTQAAPEKVKAQSRWAQLRVKHVDEVVAKKRKDLMKGFTEFQEHMRDWPAFVVKVRTCGGGGCCSLCGYSVHSFVRSLSMRIQPVLRLQYCNVDACIAVLPPPNHPTRTVTEMSCCLGVPV